MATLTCQHKTKDGNPLDGWRCRECGELFREQTDEEPFEEMRLAVDRQERETLEGSLARILALKEQQKAITDELALLEGPVRQYLELGGQTLVDGEHQITATVKERNRPASIDLSTLATNPDHAAHIVEAARAGVLTASLTPLRAMKGRSAWADALLKAEMPGGVQYVLEVRKA